jgi:hypothetical protein
LSRTDEDIEDMTGNMTCVRCKREKAEIELAHLPGKMCRQCFIGIVERRVRKNARTKGYFDDGESIIALDDGSANAAVASYFLRMVTEYRSPKIKAVRVASPDKADGRLISSLVKKYPGSKIVLPTDADQEAALFLAEMAGEGHRKPNKRVIKLISCLSRKEVGLFAGLKGFKYTITTPQGSVIAGVLDRLEAESPDIKFAVCRSLEAIDADKRGVGKDGRKRGGKARA